MLSVAVAQLILLLLRPDGVAADQSSVEGIEIWEPAYRNLSCIVADAINGKPNSIKGYWTKDGEEINQTQVTIERKMEQYHLQKRFYINGSSLGNYSCVFINGNNSVTKTFFIHAPSMKDKRDKPIVSYFGDSSVLTCKINPKPSAWEWYKVNGTEKGMINVTDKMQLFNDESHLNLVNLVEEDSGTYVCIATYPIGPVRGEVILRVLSFMEPLKPFLVVLVEVVLLVFLILLCECQGRKKGSTAVLENGTHIDQTEKPMKEESSGIEETTARRRKV
ncbi:embigin [Brienomyrus brachyistius]|uniref:embigin n=1 Tax=Brienomyrus brachyistius TaxID=42636 RepID=UPI0020B1F515|nr:embigin [Brienomyrus brachyistius]